MHFMYCPILFSSSLLRQHENSAINQMLSYRLSAKCTHTYKHTHEATQACAQVVEISSSEVCRLERCLTELRCQKPDSAAMLTWSLLLTHNNMQYVIL